ncbi:MAG TPA: transglutaminaseTgpA domain-containing protein [Pseudonocardia sp.]|nr:transglutaminaseTgpA domain-containing protein [Pseudonocardia sp.]
MTALAPAPVSPTPPPRRRTRAWARPVWAGIALLLAGSPVAAVVQGTSWWGYAAGAVALVVAVGLLGALRPTSPALIAVAQLAALAGLVTALFTDSGVLRVLPGPAAASELGALVGDAATQIRSEAAPVPATPAMLLLVTLAFGVTAVAVHAVTVGAAAPAAAGVLMLAVFAVPTALADDLLPSWMLVAAAAGFGLLLFARPGPPSGRRQWRPGAGGAAIVAAAIVLALAAGVVAEDVGTAGRFPSSGGAGAGRGTEIGLSPFTALRGELQEATPTELFRVTGLPRPAYLRALTLSTYVPDAGWQLRRPGPGTPLTGELPAAGVPGDRASVRVENVGFRDYWLPVYGVPLGVSGLSADGWSFDPPSGTAYSTRPRQEQAWTQDALLPAPTADSLRAADGGAAGVDPTFLATDGVDPRVAALAREVTAGAPTGFDRAVALTQWFTGPGSSFTYDLSTAPGNGDDALVEFLTTGRRGYCEQFASAMAVMLRTLGVPARVAVGFTGGRDDAGARSVGTADAHAWVEAWFPGAGWTTFDPTPLTDGRAIVPPYVAPATGESDSPAEEQPAPAETPPAPEDTATPEAGTPETVAPEPAAAPDATPGGSTLLVVLGSVTALLATLAAALAGPTAWRARLRRRRLTAADGGGAGAAGAAWDELLAESADRGAPAVPSDTVRTAADRMTRAHGLDAPVRRALDTVVGTVEESWYGGVDPAPGALTDPLTRVSDALRAVPVPLHRRLFPASLIGRGERRADRGRDDQGGDDTAVARR